MPKSPLCSKVIFTIFALSASFVEAAPVTRIVDNTSNDPNLIGTLPYWLLNANDEDIIDCSPIAGQSITLNASLPAISKDYTINAAGITIDGAGSYQAFQVASGNVVINEITVKNTISKGGDGGNGYSGGGGAVGGGGALYIHGGTEVTLTAASLLNNIAQGGNGGSANDNRNAGGGGGGGYGGGNGGNPIMSISTGGGGGGHSNGGNGGSDFSVNGSNGVYFGGGGGGGGINVSIPGGIGGNASPNGTFIGGAESGGNGGGGAGSSENGFSATGTGGSGIPGNGGNGIGTDFLFGAGGGGGSSSETGAPGGIGIGAAGGGGGYNDSGGAGGILGGGGGGGLGGVGGDGGFGAGGGGALIGGIGGGGFNAGGGHGASTPDCVAGGGGGSGLGGAIFIQKGAHLTIVDAKKISNNTAVAGAGGSSNRETNPDYIPPGNGAAMGHDIFMREEGFITFDLRHTLTVASPIEGDQTNGPNTIGGLNKIGKGTLKLNGANTYSGTTTISEGTLNLNGSVIGNAIVGIDGKLSGNATVAGNLISSGILAPGNSIGTINTTNLVLASSNLLEIEVASNGTNNLITAAGTAQINGTLEVSPLPGNFQTAQSYTIITSEEERTGFFSTIGSNVPSLLEVIYEPNAVVLEVLPLSSLKLDSNAAAAASCYLTNELTTGSDEEAINTAFLTLDKAGINNGFNQMQPAQFSGLAWSQIQNTLLVRSSYSQHLNEVNLTCNCSDRFHAWGEAIGAWQTQNSTGQQFGFTNWSGGATMGFDAVCSNEIRLGIAGSYTYSRLNWHKSAGHSNVNSYYGGLYADWSTEIGYVNAIILGAYSHYQTDRHLHFATIDRHAKSSHNSWEGVAGFETGFHCDCNERMRIIPFVRMDYIYLSQQRFTESGAASLDLRVARFQNQILQSELGVIWTGRYAYENPCAPGTIVPRIKLSYINDTPFGSRHLHASFVDSGCDFTVKGLRFYRNFGAISLGLSYLNCNETISVTLRYDGQCSSNYYTQAANIAVDIQF